MLNRWKRAGFYVLAIATSGVGDDVTQVGILPDEFGNVARRQAEQVVNDEHLPIAMRPGADATRWDFERCGDLAGDRGGNAFQDHSKCPGLLTLRSIGV